MYKRQSHDLPIEVLAGHLYDSIKEIDVRYIVTHSMGGILTRYLMSLDLVNIEQVKIATIAPPNDGSEVIDNLQKHAWFRNIQGP